MGMRLSYRCEDCGYEHAIYPGGLDFGMDGVVRQVRCSSCNEIVEFWANKNDVDFHLFGEGEGLLDEWFRREKKELAERPSTSEADDEDDAMDFYPFSDWARRVIKYGAKCDHCSGCDFEETTDWKKLENEDSNDSLETIWVKCPKCGGKMKDDGGVCLWD